MVYRAIGQTNNYFPIDVVVLSSETSRDWMRLQKYTLLFDYLRGQQTNAADDKATDQKED